MGIYGALLETHTQNTLQLKEIHTVHKYPYNVQINGILNLKQQTSPTKINKLLLYIKKQTNHAKIIKHFHVKHGKTACNGMIN